MREAEAEALLDRLDVIHEYSRRAREQARQTDDADADADAGTDTEGGEE